MPATLPASPGEAQYARAGTSEAHKHDQMGGLRVEPHETQQAQAEGYEAKQ